MKDISQLLKPEAAIVAAALDADATGLTIDMKGAESVMFVANVGIEGVTLSGTDKIALELEESDDDSSWSAVDTAEIVRESSQSALATNQWALFDADAELPAVVKCGYIGSKRYVRPKANFSGTHGVATPVAVTAIKGNLHGMPPA